MPKPFSQACENNKAPILNVLSQYLTLPGSLLEVGSGTGQHAIHMAKHLPHINWQPSDRAQNIEGIELWRQESGLNNLMPATIFDVLDTDTYPEPHDHLFSANTLHIMSWDAVTAFFNSIPSILNHNGYAFFYGPFKYQGQFTSPSNASFELWLKQQAAHQGIRGIEAITELAQQAGLELIKDVSMPANNQTLIWRMNSSH